MSAAPVFCVQLTALCVCVWHCHDLGWGKEMGMVREGTHPRVFK